MFDLIDVLAPWIKALCAAEQRKRDLRQRIEGHESAIRWITKELDTHKMSAAQRGEYRHQIRYHEISIAFEEDYS